MELNINGKKVEVDVAEDTPLLWAIRDGANLTGTKYGCGMSLCGACTVFIDGKPTRSCVTPISTLKNKKITTIEGLKTKVSELVQQTWTQLSVPQCGYCQSGQVMAAVALLSSKANPNDADIDAAMKGHICRCGTYSKIREAIKETSKRLRK